MSGERGRNRTYNLLIKSQLLCQLSYAPTVGISGKARTKIIAFNFHLRVNRARRSGGIPGRNAAAQQDAQQPVTFDVRVTNRAVNVDG